MRGLRQRGHEIRMLGSETLLAFVVLWSVLVTWLSAQPAAGEGPSPQITRLLFNAGHAPLFGIWAAGVAFWLAARTPRPLPDLRFGLAALAATALFGAVDEWHQSNVDGRTSSWTDVATDCIGAAITIACLRHLASPRTTPVSFVVRVVVGALAMLGAGWAATRLE